MIRMRKGHVSARTGFTMVEILVMLLVTAILMSLALPAYLSATADSQAKYCRANMQIIANAVITARIKAHATNYSGYIGSVSVATEPDLFTLPICPSGGTYTVADGNSNDTTTFKVSCSASGHGTFQPGVDNY